ncbi:DELLA protein GAIP-like [Salvia splendens]|nr:DELLA protein GAIP-like [Salvia splendens]
MLELDEKSFSRVDVDEVVVVYAEYTLSYMIGGPDRLHHVMKVARGLRFRVMVVAEVEANCNSPIFVERFVEAMLFYGAYFESMAGCVKSEEHRCIAEATCFGSSIRNVVAAEGRKRKIRHVGIGVWRAFFARFVFEETELSMSSVYQANLVVKNFASGSFFTFGIDGKSLIIGWKGTPMSSISAWRFDLF